jgi:hypothetical protein
MNKIAGYPIEIVNRMLECQENQGNKADLEVFKIKGPDTNSNRGGFDWGKTSEGVKFWSRIFNKKDFNHFFQYHNDIIRSGIVIEEDWDIFDLANANNSLEEEFPNNVIEVGTKVIVEEDTGRKSIKRLISYNPDFPEPYLTITEKAWNLLLEGNTSEQRFKAYKDCEKYIEEPIVELTLKDISEGKGVGVPPHLIKIIG